MPGEAQGLDRGQGTQTSFLQTLSELPCVLPSSTLLLAASGVPYT